MCVSEGKKCSFFGKFGVPCFLITSPLRFALLPYCQRLTEGFTYFKTISEIRLCWKLKIWRLRAKTVEYNMIVANSIASNHSAHKTDKTNCTFYDIHDGFILCSLKLDWFLSYVKTSQISGSGYRRTSRHVQYSTKNIYFINYNSSKTKQREQSHLDNLEVFEIVSKWSRHLLFNVNLLLFC